MDTVYVLDHFIPIVRQWGRHLTFLHFLFFILDEKIEAKKISDKVNQNALNYVYLIRFYYLKPF